MSATDNKKKNSFQNMKKNLPIFILFLGDRERVTTEKFSLLGGSNFALGKGTMFWGVSLWAPPQVPLPLTMCGYKYRQKHRSKLDLVVKAWRDKKCVCQKMYL